MIIPSIDLQSGNAVQLIGGKALELDAGDPRPIAERFRLAGEVAVIDLDAAMGKGSNEATILELLKIAPCRVGGGIRDVDTAIKWLDAGASKIILGTAARPEILRELPADRVIAALDAVHGEVVVEGWATKTGRNVLDRIDELNGLVGGFLVTFVEKEGRLGGTDFPMAEQVVARAGTARVTIAGGVTTASDIARLDALGADAQVGMALYKNLLSLGDAIAAPLVSDRPDGLWPTVVCDEQGVALGLVYSNLESLREAVASRRGVYHSRSRGLWKKGESSGAYQELLRIDLDCDRDALRFTVRQHGAGFCHHETRTCWGEDRGLTRLVRRIEALREQAPAGSYTRRLFDDPTLLEKKLVEEAGELAQASGPQDVAWETADLLYFALVAMVRSGVPLSEVEAMLDRRALKLTRRPGDAKES
ncbi:MAG: phosphoribosyl-ATP diphosphatase [Bradymonadaceae bacterium]|nr:phosphoribosyl-ATP diphosphatase [Lujinxingiaceae bacterium]